MKKIIHAFFLVTVSLLPYSCTLEQELDPNHTVTTAKKAEVILRLKTPSDYTPASRSLTYGDENAISDVYVLVFDKTSTLVRIEEGKNVSSSAGNSNPSYSGQGAFTVTLNASNGSTDTYKLVVLANAKTIITNTIGFDVSAVSDKSYSAVRNAINEKINGSMYKSGGTIPMWGESGQLVVSSGSSNQSLQLTRSIARIDVGVGKATKDNGTDIWSWDGKDATNVSIPFKLGHVYVIKPNNSYAVIPDAGKASGMPTVPSGTTAFSLSDSENKFAFTATASSTGGYTSRDIYIPEADIKMSTSAKPGDSNHTNRMAIVVGGYYNGNMIETFYRIDFARDGDLVNVLRNHLYQFNISKVSGDGYPDVETAYNSSSMNMAVDINEWDETDMGNVVFDGQYILSVSQDEYYFPCEAKSAEDKDNVLYVKTDYETSTESGWEVDKIVDGVDKVTPITWVSLSPTTGVANDKTKVILTVEKNNNSKGRSAIIWFAAGRLRYPVKVMQSSYRIWACSNIVWDGSKLTFAVTPEDNKLIPANSQGVLFQWGSLVAISPTTLEPLDVMAVTYKEGHYPDGHILFSPTGIYDYDWTDIPYISEMTSPFNNSVTTEDDFATYNNNTGFNAAEGKGDICRYISAQGWVSGKWRLPTADEIEKLIDEQTSVSNGSFTRMLVTPNGANYYGYNAYGYYQHESGRWLGTGATLSSGVIIPLIGVYFSAGGCRGIDGLTNNVGGVGYYWSGSSVSTKFSYHLAIDPSMAIGQSCFRQFGNPVRCIRD